MVDVSNIIEENVIIPIYIFKKGALLVVGEALIGKENGKYFGSFDFDTLIDFGEKIEFPMNLVTGEKGQRSPVGIFEFRRHRNGTEYTGSIEFADELNLHLLIPCARSLVNV